MNHTLSATDFSSYPPQARRFASDHIATLRSLPPVFCALLLNEIRQYDWQFPAERNDLAGQLKWIESPDRQAINSVLAPFAALKISRGVMDMPWSEQPGLFIERLTADLWITHSIDAFYAAGKQYGALLQKIRSDNDGTKSRLCIVFIGSGSERGTKPLFEKLQPNGTYFSRVDLSQGVADAIACIRNEVTITSSPYQHWYVDGGVSDLRQHVGEGRDQNICSVSYAELDPVRKRIVQAMNTVRSVPGNGPEQLRTVLDRMRLANGNQAESDDPVMREFVVRLFAEGSGTQIFSTTFVQWAGREILRRARPQSLFLRFRLRQTERPMDELLTEHTASGVDPQGSLVDADMGAFYTWINLQRLPGFERSRFVVCFENGHEALAIGPGVPKATKSNSDCTLKDILTWAT
jgi:hypothetical protein